MAGSIVVKVHDERVVVLKIAEHIARAAGQVAHPKAQKRSAPQVVIQKLGARQQECIPDDLGHKCEPAGAETGEKREQNSAGCNDRFFTCPWQTAFRLVHRCSDNGRSACKEARKQQLQSPTRVCFTAVFMLLGVPSL